MFIEEQTCTRIHADLDSTVSHGTHRPQDLIPTFLSVIRDTQEYVQIMNVIPAYVMEDDNALWWDSEDCSYFLNEVLFNTLDAYAPYGFYFGSHLGDGSDYGFWKEEDDGE